MKPRLSLDLAASCSATRRATVVVAAATAAAGVFGWHTYQGSAASSPVVSRVTVTGINNRGQIIGMLWLTSGVRHGFVWRRGSLTLLGRSHSSADEINEHGEILGYDGKKNPVLWEHGKTRSLAPLSAPWALNNRGQVLGSYQSRPALWTDGKITLLPFRWVAAMNDRTQVVGETSDGQAAEWQNGKLTNLGYKGEGLAINDRGEIVGRKDNEDVIVWQNGRATDIGPGTPVAINERGEVLLSDGLWRNGKVVQLGVPAGVEQSWTTAISNRGQVIGSFQEAPRGPVRGFVWQNGAIRLLPRPKNGAPSLKTATAAVAINDQNQIVGNNCVAVCDDEPDVGRFAFLWVLRGGRIKTRQLFKGHF